MAAQLTGIRRFIWTGGLLISMMFILMMFVRIVLSILDSSYDDFAVYIAYAAYGLLHLVVNSAFKTNRTWGSNGLMEIYSLWGGYALFKAITNSGSGISLITAVVVALGSALMLTFLIQSKSKSSSETRQAI